MARQVVCRIGGFARERWPRSWQLGEDSAGTQEFVAPSRTGVVEIYRLCTLNLNIVYSKGNNDSEVDSF